jgi:hypothetical protein
VLLWGFAMRLSLLLVSVVVASAAPANAASVLFSQNFDSLPVGVPAASLPGFTISGGGVDVVQSGTFSIDCVGGTGKCLDLAGSPGPGTITSDSINFLAGRRIDVSFTVSGNQRSTASDNFGFNLIFGQPTSGCCFDVDSGPASFNASCWQSVLNQSGPYTEVIAGTRSFITYSAWFIADQSGTFQLVFSGEGLGNVNIGPILDNVLVTQAAIPEPQSWAMLIAGFGLIGAMQRRRKAALAA